MFPEAWNILGGQRYLSQNVTEVCLACLPGLCSKRPFHRVTQDHPAHQVFTLQLATVLPTVANTVAKEQQKCYVWG